MLRSSSATKEFMSKIIFDKKLCLRCGQCTLVCVNGIIQRPAANDYPACIDGGENICIDCYHCVAACPDGAITVGEIGRKDCLEYDQTAAIRFEHIAHLVRKRRSIRRYAETPMEDRVIEQLLDVLRWTPTAKNGQPLKWVVINDAVKVRELAGIIMEGIKKQPKMERMIEVWDGGGDPIFRGAPCVIAAYTDDATASWATMDAAIAVTTLDLCVSAMRLGTCWAGIFIRAAQSFAKSTVNQWLGLNETATIHGALMIGHIGEETYQRIPYRPESPKIWIR